MAPEPVGIEASTLPDSSDRICKWPVVPNVVTYALSPSTRMPVGASSIGKERNNVLPSGEKHQPALPLYLSSTTHLWHSSRHLSGRTVGCLLKQRRCNSRQNQATSEFLNMYFRVFMVYYIFFALLYPNSREMVWATFLIQSADVRTTSFDNRPSGLKSKLPHKDNLYN